MNPIVLDKEQPYNFTEIIRFTDNIIDMLNKLNCLYLLFYTKIKHLRECKHLYSILRQKYPNLFT